MCASFVLKKKRPANDLLFAGIEYYGPGSVDHFLLIFHETPGSRYSLVPGDFLSPGSKKETVKLGELKSIGLNKKMRVLGVQRDRKTCKDYPRNESQALCRIRQVLLPKLVNFTGTSG